MCCGRYNRGIFVHVVEEVVEVSVLACFARWTGFVLLTYVVLGSWVLLCRCLLVLFFFCFIFGIDHFLVVIFGRMASWGQRLWRQWLRMRHVLGGSEDDR